MSKTRIMLYVEDVDQLATFWQTAFHAQLVTVNALPAGYHNPIVAISDQVELALFPRDFIRQYSPEVLDDGVPSLMFFRSDFADLHARLPHAGEIVETNGVRTFNFTDPAGNYFVVAEED